MSEVPHVYKAIHGVLADLSITGIAKDRKNETQKYRFRGIDDVLNALSGSLVKNQLIILPTVLARAQTERESKGGGALFSVVTDVEYTFISAVDGSSTKAKVVGEAMDSADKATNKAMSAAYKYMALQTFCIPTEGDNDADATTHEPAPRRQQKPSAPEGEPTSTSPAGTGPLAKELGQLLDKYGAQRAAFAQKTAEAFGVKSVDDIPEKDMPKAILRVLDHQNKAAKRKKPEPAPADAGGVAGPIDDVEIPL